METTITLQGIKISNHSNAAVKQLHDYFDFAELYHMIQSEQLNYRWFIEGMDIRYRMLLLGPKKTDDRDMDFIDMVNDPLNYMKGQKMRYCEPYNGFFRVMHKAILGLLNGYYELIYQNQEISRKDWPAPDKMKSVMEQVLNELTRNGARCFSPEGAAELFTYCILHMAFGILPKGVPECGFDVLCDDLDRLCPVTKEVMHQNMVIMITDQSKVSLPFYAGSNGKGKTEIVQLENKSDNVCIFQLGETVVSAAVPAQGTIYALRRNGGYIGFLPRVALCGSNWIRCEKNGKLRACHESGSRYLETDIKQPVCWAYCNEYGTLVLDSQGKIDQAVAMLDYIPQQPAVSVSAFGMDYCLVLEDGNVESALLKKDWKGMIGAWNGWDQAIGIDFERVPVLDDGTRLEGFCAVAAACGKDHYICLNEKGGVLTDSNFLLNEPVYAVAVGFGMKYSGYVMALRNSVNMYSFDNQLIRKWEVSGVNELAASNKLLVWRSIDDPAELHVEHL